MNVTVLCGGVGGARLARGFEAHPDAAATLVVNTGDDDDVHGLHVAADLDTVLYTLAGVQGPDGWGRSDEQWTVMTELERLSPADTSFRLGDRDLAVNLYRTGRLRAGDTLSAVTADLAAAFHLESRLLPATDDPVRTEVETDEGWLDFQTYFVRRRHRDDVLDVRYRGIERARPAPGVIEAIESADLVVIAPSNPIMSVWPIIRVGDLHARIARRPTVAISPLIGGIAVKGPTVAAMQSQGLEPTVQGIALAYRGLIDVLFVDRADHDQPLAIDRVVTDIMLPTTAESIRLADEVMQWVL